MDYFEYKFEYHIFDRLQLKKIISYNRYMHRDDWELFSGYAKLNTGELQNFLDKLMNKGVKIYKTKLD